MVPFMGVDTLADSPQGDQKVGTKETKIQDICFISCTNLGNGKGKGEELSRNVFDTDTDGLLQTQFLNPSLKSSTRKY